MSLALVTAVRDGLATRADPDAAVSMQAYMKSAMPFRGVAKPAREGLLREVVAAHPVPDAPALLAEVRALWDGATFREERYLALAVLGHRRYRAWAEPGWVADLFQGWIVEGGWWDFTDEIANRHVGPLVAAHGLAPLMREWSVHPDRWLRRTSVICQLGAKDRTDLGLLTDAIEANLGDPDFFLRKGIGWALRQYFRTDPEWVRTFVDTHPALSPLSRREALKHLRSASSA
ncbi:MULTISPECIES: DNA alkylation repair protein [unclassified Pseudonocardia]|uniref:DNA alkylation repair protein n=1 Tax=unclassified Pseudonocardia TaxID=2619320 RepID=UPI0009663A4F|nr:MULTISPECIES: DNA alkylation repair protein [unclassified Pseudonocardia]MBN9102460.1 DNA alkylation repair protein [Pseudonocardia sp.]OJY53788.1 MAG: DNA alkylation repair protein [Pseudonocardia sp. 73-21]